MACTAWHRHWSCPAPLARGFAEGLLVRLGVHLVDLIGREHAEHVLLALNANGTAAGGVDRLTAGQQDASTQQADDKRLTHENTPIHIAAYPRPSRHGCHSHREDLSNRGEALRRIQFRVIDEIGQGPLTQHRRRAGRQLVQAGNGVSGSSQAACPASSSISGRRWFMAAWVTTAQLSHTWSCTG
jgi:hypothetical protein